MAMLFCTASAILGDERNAILGRNGPLNPPIQVSVEYDTMDRTPLKRLPSYWSDMYTGSLIPGHDVPLTSLVGGYVDVETMDFTKVPKTWASMVQTLKDDIDIWWNALTNLLFADMLRDNNIKGDYDSVVRETREVIANTLRNHDLRPVEYVLQTLETNADANSRVWTFSHQFDSIVVSSLDGAMEQENPDAVWRNPETGDIIGVGGESIARGCQERAMVRMWTGDDRIAALCQLNELFICPAMQYNMQTLTTSKPFSFDKPSQSTAFFRSDIKVSDLRYFKFSNPCIKLYVRWGEYDNACEICDGPTCGSYTMEFPKDDKSRTYVEYTSPEPVTCFFFELVRDGLGALPSCQVGQLRTGDYSLHSELRNGAFLPSYLRKTVDTQYAVSYDSPADLTGSRKITACDPGLWYGTRALEVGYDQDWCYEGSCNDDMELVQCVDYELATACAITDDVISAKLGQAPEYLQALTDCMGRLMEKCRNYKLLREDDADKLIRETQCVRATALVERGYYYWDISDKAMQSDAKGNKAQCVHGIAAAAFSSVSGSPVQVRAECAGAYRGQLDCFENPDQIQPTPAVWFAATETSCELCAICDAAEGRFYQYGCEYWYGPDSEGFFGHMAHNAVCVDCDSSSCPLAEYRDCTGVPERNRLSFVDDDSLNKTSKCTECECPPLEGEEVAKYICFVNTTVCDGNSLVDEGAYWISLFDMVCPAGYFLKVKPIPGKQTNLTAVLWEVCLPCSRPDLQYRDGTQKEGCARTTTWLGCPEPGAVENPVCTPCPIVEYADFSVQDKYLPADECKIQCYPGYILDYRTGREECVSCQQPCSEGEYRPSCAAGATTLPECTACVKNDCAVDSWSAPCNGMGYGYVNIDRVCTGCRTRESHPTDCAGEDLLQWKRCTSGPGKTRKEDDSECVLCSTTYPNSSVQIDEATCGWECIAEYYRTGDECTKCTESLVAVCARSKTTGCAREGCDAVGETRDARCVCLPGYAWVEDAGLLQSRCKECPPGQYSNADTQGCVLCPHGYQSNQPSAATSCMPCAANTYRGVIRHSYLGMANGQVPGECMSCEAGTSGVIGSTACTRCEEDAGLLAIEVFVPRRVRNYVSRVGAPLYQLWNGTVPTHCGVPGGNTDDTKICEDGDYRTIRFKDGEDGGDGEVKRVGHALVPEFRCGVCDNGLAYSATWGIDALFAAPDEL
jgi:hypothetical protein